MLIGRWAMRGVVTLPGTAMMVALPCPWGWIGAPPLANWKMTNYSKKMSAILRVNNTTGKGKVLRVQGWNHQRNFTSTNANQALLQYGLIARTALRAMKMVTEDIPKLQRNTSMSNPSSPSPVVVLSVGSDSLILQLLGNRDPQRRGFPL